MFRPSTCLLRCLLLLLALSANAAVIVVPADVLRDYEALLNGQPVETVTQYGGPYSRRDTVELVLTQQALRLGGYRGPIQLTEADSYARTLVQLQSGQATLTGTSIWLEDLQGRPVDVSPPLIEDGQFEAGLFTSPDNRRALRSQDLAAIRQLRSISNKAWTVDWRVLSQLQLQGLESTPVWTTMARMVAMGRADFVLAPFQPSRDGSLAVGNVRLVPIPGVKLVLPGSRHLAISRTGPDAAEVRAALDKGIALLRSRQILNRAYQQAGFFNPQSHKLRALKP